MAERSEKLTFPGATGHQLAGRLELPDGDPSIFGVFAHCFTCSKDIAAASRISRALCALGVAVLRFDFTGIGNSDGDFANTDFSSNQEDLIAAADFLREHHRAPSLLVGHSLGGAAVLGVAARIPEVEAVCTIGAPGDPRHVERLLTSHLSDIEATGFARVELAGRTFEITREFLEDLREENLLERVQSLDAALLIFHSPVDRVVGIEEARKIYEAARHPKSFISLDDADHLLTDPRDSTYVARTIAAWAERYIPEVAERAARAEGARPSGRSETTSPAASTEASTTTNSSASPAPAPAAPGSSTDEASTDEAERAEGVVDVAEQDGGLAQRIQAGGHTLVSDEPSSAGGTNIGPTPYDLLLASLGACTSMTIRMYAKHKGIPVESIRVRLSHRKMHALDCASCETREGKIDRIDRELTVTGPLTEEQRQKILVIADKCPVHRTLLRDKEIRTRFAG